jgi:hypothetical protein
MTLVDEACHWWRLWSVRLYALMAFLVCAAMQYPEILTAPLAYVPGFYRPAAVAIVGIVTFALPTAARLLKQRLPDAR